MQRGHTEGSASIRMENNGGPVRIEGNAKVGAEGQDEGGAKMDAGAQGGVRGFFGRLFGR